MERDKFSQDQDVVFSQRIRAGKRRTYFFDVRRTKGDDFYITLTESTRHFDDGVLKKHKIFLYKEDFNRFLAGLQDTIDHVKNNLITDYDYDEFDRRQEEYEQQRRLAGDEIPGNPPHDAPSHTREQRSPSEEEDEMSW